MIRETCANCRVPHQADITSNNLGDQAEALEMVPVLTHSTTMWLCHPCIVVLRGHVEGITRLFPALDPINLSWSGLYHAKVRV